MYSFTSNTFQMVLGVEKSALKNQKINKIPFQIGVKYFRSKYISMKSFLNNYGLWVYYLCLGKSMIMFKQTCIRIYKHEIY